MRLHKIQPGNGPEEKLWLSSRKHIARVVRALMCPMSSLHSPVKGRERNSEREEEEGRTKFDAIQWRRSKMPAADSRKEHGQAASSCEKWRLEGEVTGQSPNRTQPISDIARTSHGPYDWLSWSYIWCHLLAGTTNLKIARSHYKRKTKNNGWDRGIKVRRKLAHSVS